MKNNKRKGQGEERRFTKQVSKHQKRIKMCSANLGNQEKKRNKGNPGKADLRKCVGEDTEEWAPPRLPLECNLTPL